MKKSKFLLHCAAAVIRIGATLFTTLLFPTPALATKTADVDQARIVAQEKGGKEWLSHGRSYSEQRFSTLTRLDQSNVAQLGLAASLDLNNNRGLESTPLMADGVLYASLSWSRVIAADAVSGKLLWEFDPQVNKEKAREFCCDVVNRGVALWKGKVFVGALDGRLIALDAKTGKLLWQTQTTDAGKSYSITGAPRVVKGKVIIGNAGAEYGVRGFFSAYDAETGKMAWRFYTVPGDPSLPYEHPELAAAAKTWMGDVYWKYGGGGTVWDSMAYDPELDLLYVGVGNGSPWNREIRSPGGGDNLFLSSILAIKPDTGKMAWYYQETPGETWDFTATQQITLADLTIHGMRRKVLMQAPKNGFFYVLDRATGELLSAEKFGKVTWAEKVDLKTGRPMESEGTRYVDKPSLQWPGSFGAHNWHSMSYNPGTGLVYIPYQEVPGLYRNEGAEFISTPRIINTGTGFADATEFPPEAASGALIAWDPAAQKIRWSVPQVKYVNGGTLTTAGNLVFQGTADGRMVAYSADQGNKLWEFDAQTGIVASPITYEIKNEQYVAIMAGWGGGAAMVGGNAAQGNGTRNVSRLLIFKRNGKQSLPPLRPATLAEAIRPVAVAGSAPQIAAGQKIYGKYCMICHGVGVVSGGVTPDLRRSAAAGVMGALQEIVIGGALSKRGMPSFADAISEQDLVNLKAYILSRVNETYEKEHSAPGKSGAR
jgi:quinohemoprotein ethanol dehydrogenase